MVFFMDLTLFNKEYFFPLYEYSLIAINTIGFSCPSLEITLSVPKSGEQQLHTAPREFAAKNAAIVIG